MRCLALLLFFVASSAFAIPPGDRWPSTSTGGGGGASMVDFCEDGTQKGVGLDATTGKYDKVCMDYPWASDTSVTASGMIECVPTTVTCTAAFGNGGEDNSCLLAGQVLQTECVVHNYWYAWENVKKPFGQIWGGNKSYEINGCGSTATACPIVYQDAANVEDRPGFDFHTIALGLGTTFHGAGEDTNGLGDGKLDGTVFIFDGNNSTATDPFDSATQIGRDAMAVGLFSGPNGCGTASPCDFDRSLQLRSMAANTWGGPLELLLDIDYRESGAGNPMQLCIPDSVVSGDNGKDGFCSGDKRHVCPASVDQATADAVCSALSAGTCLSQSHALDDEMKEGCVGVAAVGAGGEGCNEVMVGLSWQRLERVGGTVIGTNMESATLVLQSVGTGGCDSGAGDLTRFGVRNVSPPLDNNTSRWNIGMADRRLDVSVQTAETMNVLHPLFLGSRNKPDGQDFTVMPSSWWGRDDDGDGASGADADCVDGNNAGVGDEAECDQGGLVQLGVKNHTSLKNVSFLYPSSTSIGAVDGGSTYYDATLDGVTVAYGVRGPLTDSGRMNWTNSEFRENNTTFSTLNVLNSGTSYHNIRFTRNRGPSALRCKRGVHSTSATHFSMEGNFYQFGLFEMGRCGMGTIVSHVVGKGNAGPVASFSPEDEWPVMGLTFRSINLSGHILENEIMTDFVPDVYAAFVFSDANSSSNITERQGVTIDDVHVKTPNGDVAFAYYEDDGSNNASDWGRYDSFTNNTLFSEVGPESGCLDDKEPWPCCTDGPNNTPPGPATGATCNPPKLVVVGDGGASEDQASEATDILEDTVAVGGSRNPPRMVGNRLFSLNAADDAIVESVTPDWPYTCRLAAETPDCDLLPHGAEVCITDDEVRGQCAATAGQLDGLGVSPEVSICVCDGAGTFTSSP